MRKSALFAGSVWVLFVFLFVSPEAFGQPCSACHTSENGSRRPIIGEFAFASHHVMGSAIEDADCERCHDMTQHQQGKVRLKNVDDPDNPTAVIILQGDPFTDPITARKLETFCLACHDADGAAGLAPFSDGIMPPVKDGTLWLDTSHKRGNPDNPLTCFGDGETFGCHGNGHGSNKRKHLAPWQANQSAFPGDPLREEEGMCFTCHDADGPAFADVASHYALTSHHNVSSLDQTDGSHVECADCHDTHLAIPNARLIDPDSSTPTRWTGTRTEFCLVCHDGSPPAGVTFPASAQGTGHNKSAFPGTAHATLLGASACVSCHQRHGSSNPSLLKGKYIIANSNPYTEGDGDFAQCWTCHDEHDTMNFNSGLRLVHDLHVDSLGATCGTCHNTHAPNDAGEAGLIDFDFAVDSGFNISYIDGRDASTAFFIDNDGARGNCYIKCHDKSHTPKTYTRSAGPPVVTPAPTPEPTPLPALAKNAVERRMWQRLR